MPLDFAKTPILLGAPLGRHALKERGVHLAVELIHVHGMHAALKPIVLRPQPADRRFVLARLVGMAGAKSIPHPSKDFLIEGQPAEQFRKLLPDDLLAGIGFIATALV